MRYKDSCHCGKVAFEVDGEVTSGIACNCSMCQRKGSILWFVPRTSFRLLTAEEDVSTYTFNKHVLKHQFCAACGIHPYAEGIDADGNAMTAINLRCLEEFDLTVIPVQHYDGRAH